MWCPTGPDPFLPGMYSMYIEYMTSGEGVTAMSVIDNHTNVHFDTVKDARDHIADLLNAAERGVPATVRRNDHRAAVVDAERLRYFLVRLHPARAQVVPEAGGWSIMLNGLPLAADGETFDEALDEMVDVLREYAEDWADHLRHAPNHADNWGLVQIIELSTDAQLKDWLRQ